MFSYGVSAQEIKGRRGVTPIRVFDAHMPIHSIEPRRLYRQIADQLRGLIEAFGGRVIASPSEETNAGRAILAEHPDSTGSLGIAISGMANPAKILNFFDVAGAWDPTKVSGRKLSPASNASYPGCCAMKRMP